MMRLLLPLLLCAVPARAEDLTAEQIVERALERNAFGFENAVAHLRLLVTPKSGAERLREVEIRSRTVGSLGRSLVRFHAPADVAGTGFLIIENQGKDDDQYLYLPALGKVKRISGTQRSQKFMGTDLTYADLESRNLRKARSRRLPDASLGGNDVYVIESIPDDPAASQYGKTITWVHRISFVPLKVEFYDHDMALMKTLTVHKLEKRDERWVVIDSTIENVQAGSKTRFSLQKLDTKARLSDDEFTERALTSG